MENVKREKYTENHADEQVLERPLIAVGIRQVALRRSMERHAGCQYQPTRGKPGGLKVCLFRLQTYRILSAGPANKTEVILT